MASVGSETESPPQTGPRCQARAWHRIGASDTARRAQVGQDALLAERAAGDADSPTVPDQEVREAAPLLARDELLEVELALHRVVLLRQAEPLREPPHVRVDDDPLRVAELRRDDVRRLPRHA